LEIGQGLSSGAEGKLKMPKIRALMITKGHPFERGPFFAMLDAID